MFQVFNVIPAGFFNNLASGSNQRIYADCMQLIYKEYERSVIVFRETGSGIRWQFISWSIMWNCQRRSTPETGPQMIWQ